MTNAPNKIRIAHRLGSTQAASNAASRSSSSTAGTTILRSGLVLLFVGMAGMAQAAGAGKTEEELVKEAIWQGVNLVLIIAVIAYFGRGAISEFFSSRREGIRSELAESAELLRQAETRNSELQRKLVDLDTEIASMKATATQRAEDEAARILSDAQATAERIRTDAQAAIAQELSRAQSQLRDEAADLALQMASKKLEDNVGDADRDRLIDEFITRVEPSAEAGARG
jgi:F-type H+-transporting ATPase subunit b